MSPSCTPHSLNYVVVPRTPPVSDRHSLEAWTWRQAPRLVSRDVNLTSGNRHTAQLSHAQIMTSSQRHYLTNTSTETVGAIRRCIRTAFTQSYALVSLDGAFRLSMKGSYRSPESALRYQELAIFDQCAARCSLGPDFHQRVNIYHG